MAVKLKDRLSEHDYQVNATEVKPTETSNLAQPRRFDIIARASPLPKRDYRVPCVNAFVYVIGVGEDKFFEDSLGALQSVGKQAFDFAVRSINYKEEINAWLYQNF